MPAPKSSSENLQPMPFSTEMKRVAQRVFTLERAYIMREGIEIVPLYLSAPRLRLGSSSRGSKGAI